MASRDRLSPKSEWVYFGLILVSALLYFNVFTWDYLYLDEAHILWHREDNSTFLQFANQGRLLSGYIAPKIYGLAHNAAELKYIRIISLLGWILTAAVLFFLSKKWSAALHLNRKLPFLLSLFCICSSAVAINIGWSIFQAFISFLIGLLSGHIAWRALTDKADEAGKRYWMRLVIAIVLGIATLLTYQVGFGIFMLPFLLVWISPRDHHRKKIVTQGVIIYLLIYLLYFFVFKFYLSALHITASDRTELVFNPLKKISFFFSTPFSQAWSFNLLVNVHSLLSQIFPFLVFGIWLFIFFRNSRGAKPGIAFVNVIGIFLLLFLSYLPPILAKENFSSYRTMVVLSVMVFAVFMEFILRAIKKEQVRLVFATVFSLFLLYVGYRNFNIQFGHPLSREFSSLNKAAFIKTVSPKDTIVFIRPDGKIFNSMYGISQYKDEFGIPSTYRDWTPDPLLRQLIAEQQSIDVARKVTIYHFEDMKAYKDSLGSSISAPVLVDMNAIIRDSSK